MEADMDSKLTRTYAIEIVYTSGSHLVAGGVTSEREAKRLARAAWDRHPGMYATISRSDGRSIEASQPYGAGMLWR